MVEDVTTYGTDRDEFNNTLTFLHPTSSNRYSDFKSGGGGAAVTVKTGLHGVFIAFIVKLGSALFSSKTIVAVIGFFSLLWTRLKGMFSHERDR